MVSTRDMAAFWIFGMANNFAYVIMLSAAGDIISHGGKIHDSDTAVNGSAGEEFCEENLVERHCSPISAGMILLADIIPTLMVKFTFPFFMHRMPFGIRHVLICLTQAASFVIVALSDDMNVSMLGVVFASVSSGLGEICFLSLTAHYATDAISMWSSGTGGAGISASVMYAVMTEPYLLNLSARTTLLTMLIVPIFFAIAYWALLTPTPSVHRVQLRDHKTWIVPKDFCAIRHTIERMEKENDEEWGRVDKNAFEKCEREASKLPFLRKVVLIMPLLRYMIPLCIVFIAQYLINQGIVELLEFDCAYGFWLSKSSQYRWYQVLYHLGVFISRSFVGLMDFSRFFVYLLPVLQLANMTVLLVDSVHTFIAHVSMVFAIILFEGFVGGASYVYTFNRIHKEAPLEAREFSLSIASWGSSLGILFAGLAAIPTHNMICSRPI